MAGFIEDLYYGNIDAQSYNHDFGAELKKKLNDLTEFEKQISDKLTGDEKNCPVFSKTFYYLGLKVWMKIHFE